MSFDDSMEIFVALVLANGAKKRAENNLLHKRKRPSLSSNEKKSPLKYSSGKGGFFRKKMF